MRHPLTFDARTLSSLPLEGHLAEQRVRWAYRPVHRGGAVADLVTVMELGNSPCRKQVQCPIATLTEAAHELLARMK